MPHAVFNLGTLSGDDSVGPRELIPGISPGGSRVGQPTKPALRLGDCYIQVNNLTDAGTANDFQGLLIELKLSQEPDLTPSLGLPIAQILAAKTATANLWNGFTIDDMWRSQGSIWVPRYVGVRISAITAFGWDTVDIDVHLDYEMTEIEWMAWFIGWDYLDNVVEGDREY